MTPLERIATIAATRRRPNRHELAAACGVSVHTLFGWLRLANGEALRRGVAGRVPPTEEHAERAEAAANPTK